MVIETGTLVSLEYTLKLEDGTEVDSNVGGTPLVYAHGTGQLIPGLEAELAGMKAGDSAQLTIKPEDGYGPSIPEAVHEVPQENVPEQARFAGAELQGQSPDGQTVLARVVEVKDETIVVDFNHPLAGKSLHFSVKVVDVQKAPGD
jgi:FKBP-type peptidyl-prolyl cis-trans isomerase SlyD